MKRIVFFCAIVLICLNVTSCTRVPISEDTEMSTGGEESEENTDPYDDGN